MAITVVCPGCLKRFSVAEKFAGKQGPCPNCKKTISIPKAEDAVVIHAPDEMGPKDAKGRSVLKTTKTKDSKFSLPLTIGVSVVSLVAVIGAVLVRMGTIAASEVVLGAGAIVLGPLLAWAGYGFLRDSELEPYRGQALYIRSAACGLGFAAGWGLYALAGYLLGGTWPIGSLEIYQMLIAAAVAVGIGAFASYVSLDIDPAVGGIHFSLYFLVTALLRVVMALPFLPGMGT